MYTFSTFPTPPPSHPPHITGSSEKKIATFLNMNMVTYNNHRGGTVVSASDFQARGQGFESRWRRPDQKGIFLLELTFVLTLHPIVLRMRLKTEAPCVNACIRSCTHVKNPIHYSEEKPKQLLLLLLVLRPVDCS